MTGVSRRGLLVGLGAAAAVGAAGWGGWELLPHRYKVQLGLGPDVYIPDAPEGQVQLETVASAARGQSVGLFTAVPAGHGDGAGLPVVVVLHGATATTADYREYGFGRFVTAAVDAGASPFVLAGVDGGVSSWERSGSDDPQAMVLDELPRWLDERGFDASTRAVWGWSMGGYGALRLAERDPPWARAVAVFSPAVSVGDSVFADIDRLRKVPLGVWCGTRDPLLPAVESLVDALPSDPAIWSTGDGAHTRVYWNPHIDEAFEFLAEHLD